MGKNNRSKKTVAEVMTEAQSITVSGPIDHHSQTSSWTPPAAPEVLDEQMVESVSAELEAQKVQAEGETVMVLDTGSERDLPADETEEDQVVTFDSLVAKLDPKVVDDMVLDIADEIDQRVAFEERVAPDNNTIQNTLKKVRAQFTASKDAARVLLAVEVSSGFINRSISEGARYNVYALGKLADIVGALSDKTISNAINNACMRSLFAFKAAGLPFTSALARAAASDKISGIEPSVRKHLIRHTVSASTAPTQASSTMQALETLGIVRRTGTRKDAVYHLTDHPAVAKLADKLGITAEAA